MPKRSKRYLTEKLFERVRAITNDVYANARSTILADPYYHDVMLNEAVKKDDVREIKFKIDEKYQELLRELPTEDLNDILFLHDRGKINRAPKTIENIIGELARRELMNDLSDPKTD